MLEQFGIPRWALLLTRTTKRRVRRIIFPPRRAPSSPATVDVDLAARLSEPFWDPVVRVADPWRRCSDPLKDSAWQAALLSAPPKIVRSWDPPPRRATLMTLATPNSSSASDNALARQLIATARATPMDWPPRAAAIAIEPVPQPPSDSPPIRADGRDELPADEPTEALLHPSPEPTAPPVDGPAYRPDKFGSATGDPAIGGGDATAGNEQPLAPAEAAGVGKALTDAESAGTLEATAAAPEAVGVVAGEAAIAPASEATEGSKVVEAPALEDPVVREADPTPSPAAAAATAIKSAAATVLAPAVRDEYNRTNLDYRRPMPRPKVRGLVIDFHCHLLARRHAEDWFEAADHYGMDCFITMSPLEEAVALARDWGHRLRFIAVPKWGDVTGNWVDKWLTRIEAFYNLGSRIAKFHGSPGTMVMRGHRLDSPIYQPLFAEVKARGMAIMTHIGDPDTWYHGRYDATQFGDRQEHYRMWEDLLEEHRGTPWIGAHMGGNPEDLPRLQRLLDRYPDLWLDCSATRWMVREISARREPAREFFIRNADRILFGSDQVSGDDRHFDFLASRIWCHRKLWETAYIGPSPILDPDLPPDQQPTLRGLALPDVVLQKIYHDNAAKLLAKIGMSVEQETIAPAPSSPLSARFGENLRRCQ